MAFVSGNLGKEFFIRYASLPTPNSRIPKEGKRIKALDNNLVERVDKNPNAEKLEALTSQNLNMPENQADHGFLCVCHICHKKRGTVNSTSQSLSSFNGKTIIREGNEKGFSYLLKILVPDRGNAPKGLKFLIADTLVFGSGEPRFLVYNSRDKYIRFIKHKDKLSLPEMRKFFQSRKKRKELDGVNFFNENTITMGKKIEENFLKAEKEKSEEPSPIQVERSSPTKKETKVIESTSHTEIVICKYNDESLQLMSELDFSYLMMKRKIEGVWGQLDYIQTYIKFNKAHPSYIRVQFQHEKDKTHPLYERARDFIYFLSEEREPELEGFDYATEEDFFEERLKAKNIFELCQYLTFKLACYMDAYCAARVKTMITEFAWEDTNLVFLTNAYKIKFFNLDEIDDYLLKEVDIVNDEERQKVYEKLQTAKLSPYQGKIEILLAFRKYYDQIKNEMGIQKEFEDSILENPASNEAFKNLNPETSFTFYDAMTNTKEFEKFKTWLQARSKEPGQLKSLYQSALLYAEANNSLKATAASKVTKSTDQKRKEKILGPDNSTKAFIQKLKALEITGNGFSRKKYIHSSEILYRSDIFAGRKLVLQESPKKSFCSNSAQKDINRVKSPARSQTVMSSTQQKFKIRSALPRPTTAKQPSIENYLSKAQSLTSILYLKSNALQ